MTEFVVLIPARLDSSRLPGKALADIHGKPMVVRVAEQAAKSKAARIVVATDHPDIQTACAKFPNARALLFDAYHPIEYGGTGQSFDWTMLHGNIGKPWILAGGLTAENVAEAVKISGAAAVDVSGGVEISGGIKSREKMAAFIQAVKAV